jgi:hypothetical protein
MPDAQNTAYMIGFFAIFATLLGPLLAVQAQKSIERWTEKRKRKMQIFHALMATRAYRLSHQHVEALNMIELEYHDCRLKKGKKVIDAWKAYHDSLNYSLANDSTFQKRDDLFIDLLYEMALYLKYDFDKISLKRSSYVPIAHGKAEDNQNLIQENLLKILSGEKSLPIAVTDLLVDQEILASQKKTRSLVGSQN